MSGLQTELAAKGFQAIESAINENPDVPGFDRQYKPTFPVGVSNGGEARSFLQIPMFMNAFVPMMAIIDREGMIREQHTGSEQDFFNKDFTVQANNLRAAIAKYLSEPVKKAAPPARKRRS